VIPYTNAGWEKLSIFLNLLTPKLPAPVEEDLAKGILEAIDMDSYRVEKRAAMKLLRRFAPREFIGAHNFAPRGPIGSSFNLKPKQTWYP